MTKGFFQIQATKNTKQAINEIKEMNIGLKKIVNLKIVSNCVCYIKLKSMAHSQTHTSLKVKCTMDEPIQLLMDKLSSKSSELYVFWQNYNQMYHHYNEKVNENNKLKEQIDALRKNYTHKVQQEAHHLQIQKDDSYLKDRLTNAEKTNSSLRQEVDNLKKTIHDLKTENSKNSEENHQLQLLINQLREENSIQKSSISSILVKLKNAQNQLSSQAKAAEQLSEKQLVISRLLEREKELQMVINEKDDEIQDFSQVLKETKMKYDKILKETMQAAKESALNSLPASMRIYREKLKTTYE